MSETFLTADLHFGHDKNAKGLGGIIYHAKRPFLSINEHDDFLIAQWNKTVGKKDITYIIGDFAWSNPNHYLMALNGKKYLITGSHDRMNQDSLRNFTEVYSGMLVRTLHKVRFVLTHCAMLVWEGSRYESINAHGHSHGRIEERDDVRRTDVGVEVSPNYTPFNVDFIIYKMSLKTKQIRNRSKEELDAIVEKNKNNNVILLHQWKELKAKSITIN